MVIQYVQTEEFLQQSIERTKKNPSLHDPRAKPWEYISGGTMPALLMAYYHRTAPFSALQKTIHNTHELLSFLIESAPKTKGSALIHSPTHAFIFHPHWLPSNPQQAILQMQNFWKQMQINDVEFLAEKLAQKLTEKEAPLFLHRFRQIKVRDEFSLIRKAFIDILGVSKELLIDSFLWESLPLISTPAAIKLASELNLNLSWSQSWMTPIEFREIAKGAFITKQGSPFSNIDFDAEIVNFLRQKGLAVPAPILFADTNWSTWFFGLAVSPAGTLELWRFHRTAMSGVPMNVWFHLQCEGEWVILNRPQEYIYFKI
jgi:hypothetical protein